MSNWRQNSTLEQLDRMFGIDLRALGVFRIGIGVLLLYDLVTRAFHLEEHYTDFGVLPVANLKGNLWDPYFWSFHTLSGELWWQALLFGVAGLFAVLLTIGWHTRIAAVVSWVLLLSLHGRNPLVLQGGDVLLRALMFWALFLPQEATLSLDARRREGSSATKRVLSVASFALLGQLVAMYIFTGYMKNDAIWERDGTALFFALSIDPFATSLGAALLAHRELCRWLTFGALYLERYGAWFAFIPWWNTPVRLLVVAAFWSLHLGMIATMNLGHFPYLCILAWIPFLPTPFWDVLERWVRRILRRPTPTEQPASICVVQPPAWSWLEWVGQGVLAILFVLVVLWNCQQTWPRKHRWYLPDALVGAVLWPRIDQMWGMFAPYPLLEDGWFVMTGTLADGRQVDLWNPGKQPTDDKPDMYNFYPSERWRKYFFNLWQVEYTGARIPFAHWLARRWNRDYAKSPGECCQQVELKFWIERSTQGNPLPWEERKLLTVKIDT